MAAVVPLLSHFPVSEHDSSSRSFNVYLYSPRKTVSCSTPRSCSAHQLESACMGMIKYDDAVSTNRKAGTDILLLAVVRR